MREIKVARFLLRTARFFTQMWDEMVTMIVIKKDSMAGPIFEMNQIDPKGSSIHVPKKEKRRRLVKVHVDKKFPTPRKKCLLAIK